MDGSDGTNTPSAGLSSPQSTQASPNPDSSGVLPDHPGSPKSVGNLTPNSSLGGGVPQRPNSPMPLTGGHKHFGNPLSAAGLLVPRHGSEALHVASMALNAVSRAGMNPSLSPLGYGTNGPRMHPASPPGMSGDGAGNECRLIDYRGAKVAAFLVNGEYLLCLPQAFELFLKHLVGGLHTVYTKLKRLDITPIVCNVEQVRILRGLGAIQPGVNRCKLLSCKDFDSLYKDCTTARPGRPPKRASLMGLGSPTVNHHHSALLKKGRLDGDYGAYENGHITGDRLDKSHLLPNGYSHHAAVSQAAATSPHINPLPFMALNHPGATHPGALLPTMPISSRAQNLSSSRTDGSVIKDRSSHGSEVINSSSREDIVDSKDRLYGFDSHRLKDPTFLNGASANGHSPVLNLSQNSSRNVANCGDQSGSEAAYNECADDEDNDTEDDEDDRDQDMSDNPDVSSTANTDRLAPNQSLPFPAMAGDLNAAAALQGVSSIETLLRNIQGLLKVAADNARHQERQINLEKAELKMEILREREVRENMEKQLLDEQRIRILYQKRLKREKKCRRRLQDQLESEVKKRTQYDEALRNSSGETLRLLNETFAQELERERNSRSEPERKIQDCPMSA